MIFGMPIIVLLFLLIGITLILIGVIRLVIQRNQCTEEVEAVCVSVDTERVRHHKSHKWVEYHTPVYKFSFEGRYYRAKGKNPNSVVHYHIGETFKLYINPNNPSQFREEGIEANIALIVIGVIWTVAVSGLYLLSKWLENY